MKFVGLFFSLICFATCCFNVVFLTFLRIVRLEILQWTYWYDLVWFNVDFQASHVSSFLIVVVSLVSFCEATSKFLCFRM